ncbi:sensor histidine kinase [Actinomadura rugatobispora]|uniref:histidine kinase n=1 Tax=Actinomadura rugatobispora TaxID=1994 RepID=A0ABW0ZUJ2_9ACTN|nr:hypothetical protein GCM10010200_016820 [Actinomadura rugatobispora]
MDEWGPRLERVGSVGGCLLRAAIGACAALYLALCVLGTGGKVFGLATIGVAAFAGTGALLTRGAERWAAAAAVLSLAITGLLGATDGLAGNPSILIEVAALLVLLARVVWRAPRPRLLALAALVGGAVVVLPLRATPLAWLVFSAPLAVLVGIALGAGLYLRAVDARRARALSDARRDERLELARDLHDFVAHHVTGIVVQAQAARYTAGTAAAQDPERLDKMLGDIEAAGTEALTSMRRMVGLLREAQQSQGAGPAGEAPDGAGGTRPLAGMEQVRELVARFSDPPATLTVDPGLGALAPEVATSLHRVVQEALTNARKHASDATSVRVSVARPRHEPGAVEVAVRDDGRGRGRRLPSGGFGLAGLSERVVAIGGELRAGPRPEGGWEVVAVVPALGADAPGEVRRPRES